MQKLLESRIFWGLLLVVGGVLFLLENLGIFKLGSLFWAILMAAGGIFFLALVQRSRDNWWALIPAFALIGLALSVGLELFYPDAADVVGGGLVLAGLALGFWAIYLFTRQWWAIIPGGVLVTLAGMAMLDKIYPGVQGSGFFFIGIGLTFVLVAILPADGDMRWAWIPAGILIVMGLLLLAALGDMMAYLWPAALILLGLGLIYRAMSRRS